MENELDSAGFPSVCCGRGDCSECPMVLTVRSVFIDPLSGLPMTVDELMRALAAE